MAKNELKNLKTEVANELGIADYESLNKGDLTSKQNGSVGGFMVKHMVENYKNNSIK